MKNKTIYQKIISSILLITMLFSLAACGDKETTNNDNTTLNTSPTASNNKEIFNTTESTSSSKKLPESSSDKTKDNTDNSNERIPVNATKVSTTAAPAKVTPASNVTNAIKPEQLANVDPEQAANKSYDTEVVVEEIKSNRVNQTDYTYVPKNQFVSHIRSVWSNFTINEKIKVDADAMKEYLNYICLPLKENFFEINCNGYEVQYCLEPTGKYALMDIKWNYYINLSQYNICRSKAAEIVNSTSGSLAERLKQINDIICKNTSYVINVDGPYNCLINKKCDCDGYAAVFQICMELLGVPCKAYATDRHIFNCVQIEGKWYVVDVTWNDQTQNGYISSSYFLVGSNTQYEKNVYYYNFPILANLLSSTNYTCNRKLVVTDDAAFRKFTNITDDLNYTLKEDGTVVCYYK